MGSGAKTQKIKARLEGLTEGEKLGNLNFDAKWGGDVE